MAGKLLPHGGKSPLKGAYVIFGLLPPGSAGKGSKTRTSEPEPEDYRQGEDFQGMLREAEKQASEALAKQGFPLIGDAHGFPPGTRVCRYSPRPGRPRRYFLEAPKSEDGQSREGKMDSEVPRQAKLFAALAGLFGWVCIGAMLATVVLAGLAIFAGWSWWNVLWAAIAAMVAKWAMRGFLDNQRRVMIEAELVASGMTREEAAQAWLDTYMAATRGKGG